MEENKVVTDRNYWWLALSIVCGLAYLAQPHIPFLLGGLNMYAWLLYKGRLHD